MGTILLPPSPNWYGSHLIDSAWDGSLVAFAAHNSVVLVKPQLQEIVGILSGHSNRVTAVAFGELSTGEPFLLSGAADCSLRKWDTKTRLCTAVVKKQHCPSEPTAIAINRECTYAFVGGKDGQLLGWELQRPAAKPVLLQAVSASPILCLCASPFDDGLVAVGCSNGEAFIAEGDLLQMESIIVNRLVKHDGGVHSICWAALHGKTNFRAGEPSAVRARSVIVTGGADGRLSVYSVRHLQSFLVPELAENLHLPSPPAGLSKAQKSRLWLAAAWASPCLIQERFLSLITSTFAGHLLLWQIPWQPGQVKLPPPVPIPGGHTRSVFGICPLKDRRSQLLAHHWQHEAETARGNCNINALEGQDAKEGPVPKSGVCTETRPVAGCTDQCQEPEMGTLSAAETSSSANSDSSISHGAGFPSRQWDLQFVTTSMDRSLLSWRLPFQKGIPDLTTGKLEWGISGCGGYASSLSCLATPPHSWALGCGDRTLRVWDGKPTAAAAKLIWRGISDGVSAVAWGPSVAETSTPLLAYGCSNGEAGLCEVAKDRCTPFSVRHKGPVRSVSWLAPELPASPVLVTLCEDGQVLLWHLPVKAMAEAVEVQGRASESRINVLPTQLTYQTKGLDLPGEHLITTLAISGPQIALGHASGLVEILQADDSSLRKWSTTASYHADIGHVLHLSWGNLFLAAAYSGAGLTCFCNSQPSVALQSLSSFKLDQDITALACSTSNLVAAATLDRRIQVFRVTSEMQLLARWPCHSGSIVTLSWSAAHANQLLSGAEDQTVRAWDIALKMQKGEDKSNQSQHVQEGQHLLKEGFAASELETDSTASIADLLAAKKAELLAKLEQKTFPVNSISSKERGQEISPGTSRRNEQPTPQFPPEEGRSSKQTAKDSIPEPSCKPAPENHATMSEIAPSESPATQTAEQQSGKQIANIPPIIGDGHISPTSSYPGAQPEKEASAEQASSRTDEKSSDSAQKGTAVVGIIAGASYAQPGKAPDREQPSSNFSTGSKDAGQELLASVSQVAGCSSEVLAGQMEFSLNTLVGRLMREHKAKQAAEPIAAASTSSLAGSATLQDSRRDNGGLASVQSLERTETDTEAAQPMASTTDTGSTIPLERGPEPNTATAPAPQERTPGEEKGGQSGSQATPAAGKKQRKLPNLGARPLLPMRQDLTEKERAREACRELATRTLGSRGASQDAGKGPLQASMEIRNIASSRLEENPGAGQAQRSAALELLRGDVAGALRAVIDADCLSADFVSMAAAGGRAAWAAASRAYAAQLESRGEPQMAALHLLATGDLDAALAAYQRAGLLHEAVTVAELRMLPGDPRLHRLYAAWGQQLDAGGHHEAAAEAFLRGKQGIEAAMALAKSQDAGAKQIAVMMADLLMHDPQSGSKNTHRLKDVKTSTMKTETPAALVHPQDPGFGSLEQGAIKRKKIVYTAKELLTVAEQSRTLVPEPAMLSLIPSRLQCNRNT